MLPGGYRYRWLVCVNVNCARVVYLSRLASKQQELALTISGRRRSPVCSYSYKAFPGGIVDSKQKQKHA
ncbi:hypothetical protein E6O75_ATG10758 [Venturia nashicola]|uniref:Uncharacterized protein n=1 Tax=Venturia nashicola TaxID=86259 RepID=A0A4Z1P293_9PEZI|nr:hypothetical protein E6O75_ATG10758 [Venturia nashicola]